MRASFIRAFRVSGAPVLVSKHSRLRSLAFGDHEVEGSTEASSSRPARTLIWLFTQKRAYGGGEPMLALPPTRGDAHPREWEITCPARRF
jgi:broad specificity phosphatase PhoE